MFSKHIGIAAVSPEGAAIFYRQIFRQAAHLGPQAGGRAGESKTDGTEEEGGGGGGGPRVSLHGEPVTLYVEAMRRQDWHAVGELLRRSAEILYRCGADLCLTPDNAVQHGIQLAQSGSPIPWLTMPELVAHAVEADGRKVVGLIGTKMVTTGSTYQTHLGLKGVQVLAPEPGESEELDRIIFSELLYGDIRPKSQITVLRIIDHLASRGCEAVILGCSEAPLLVTPENSHLPIYDAAEILATGALRSAAEG